MAVAPSPILRPRLVVVVSCMLLVPCTARGAETDSGVALLAAGGLDTLGLIVGGALLAAGRDSNALNNAGWLTMQAGFTLSPLAAHAVVGEWGRGVAFAALPASALAGTAVVFGLKPNGVTLSRWPEQWLLWGLFSSGLAASVVGAIDAVLARDRDGGNAFAVWPTVGAGQVGLSIEGRL